MKVGVGAEGGDGEVDGEGEVDDDQDDDDDGLDGGDGEAGEGGRRSLLALFSFSGSSTSLVFEAAEGPLGVLIQLRATTHTLCLVPPSTRGALFSLMPSALRQTVVLPGVVGGILFTNMRLLVVFRGGQDSSTGVKGEGTQF